MPSPLVVSVSAAGDDGYWYGTTFDASQTKTYIGYPGVDVRSFFRWQIAIPKGATITSAVAQLVSSDADDNGAVATTVGFAAADNPSAPTTAETANTLLSQVTNGVAWSFSTAWTLALASDTTDFTASMQAIVNRSGWASGNYAVFIIANNGSVGYRRVAAYGLGYPTAKLTVTYTEGGTNATCTLTSGTATATGTQVTASGTTNVTSAVNTGTATASGTALSVYPGTQIEVRAGPATAGGTALTSTAIQNPVAVITTGEATASGSRLNVEVDVATTIAVGTSAASGRAVSTQISVTRDVASGTAAASGTAFSVYFGQQASLRAGAATASGWWIIGPVDWHERAPSAASWSARNPSSATWSERTPTAATWRTRTSLPPSGR